MSRKHPKGRAASPEPVPSSSETALAKAAGDKSPARTLSGAFAAALGAKPQLGHSGPASPPGAGHGKLRTEKTENFPIKNSKPGAPVVPRKGHR